ncbi:MAG: 5-guanidino-2-oxopentanoate decarboxylase [Neisseriaceae bacterium]|nr:5-guanidino-2-oxopentanoate decarboxylase [Neisseriaceae bacterium]
MIQKRMSCGEYLVKALEAYGVELILGIPGVHTIELYRGLKQSRMRHVTPRHEQGAGFMADGYARSSGRVAACFIITGPGMTNILTAMAQAYSDSIPMLVISSVNARPTLGMRQGRLHELPNQQALVAGVSAFSHTLLSPDELPQVLARAFAVFDSERPRPVHIELPLDVIKLSAAHLPEPRRMLAMKPRAAEAALVAAYELLGQAQRPLLLLGGGCVGVAQANLVALAEAFDMATAYTINAKGCFPAAHPLSLGSNQSLSPVRTLMAKADVVLAIGTELGETDYDTVFDGGFVLPGRIIRVDLDAQQLNGNFCAHLGVVGDSADFCQRLVEHAERQSHVSAHHPQDSAGVKAVRQVRSQIGQNFWPAPYLYQHQVLATIQAAFPDAVWVGDSTQIVYSGNHLFEAKSPRQWFNAATGYGTLGYGLPAAIGAQLVDRTRPVVALVGDGGLQFSLPELATAVEEGLPLVVLLWNNQGYQEIKRYMLKHEIEPVGVDIYTPDFLAIATGYGCAATELGELAELPNIMAAALARSQPTVVLIDEAKLYRQLAEAGCRKGLESHPLP